MITRELNQLEAEPIEPVKSKVVLDFFRHGQKEKAEKPDEEIRLTEKGRQQAKERGKEIHPQVDVSMALGSPRKRTQETAARVMLAERDQIEDDMSLEEIENVIASGLSRGKKVVADPRLDFIAEKSSPLGREMLKSYQEGHLMAFLVNDSDRLAREIHDTKGSTYKRLAANIAELINKYLRIGNSYEKIRARKSEKYKDYGDQIERYFGTHQSVGESFVLKLIEKVQGQEKRDEFVRTLGGGFDELQGFRVEITNDRGKQNALLTVKIREKEYQLPIEQKMLEEIIEEGRQTYEDEKH